MAPRIEEFAALIPESLMDAPGSAFHSGRLSFERQSGLYIIGKQSGASRKDSSVCTVKSDTHRVLHNEPGNWSAYRDQSWAGHNAGSTRMQRGLLHLFERLGLDAGLVPAAHLVFECARRGEMEPEEFQRLARDCWPFHQAVIAQLKVRVIVCLGREVAKWVHDRLAVNALVEEFVENNRRGWKSRTYIDGISLTAIDLTYPGVADWTNPKADPTGLVVQALERAQPRILVEEVFDAV